MMNTTNARAEKNPVAVSLARATHTRIFFLHNHFPTHSIGFITTMPTNVKAHYGQEAGPTMKLPGGGELDSGMVWTSGWMAVVVVVEGRRPLGIGPEETREMAARRRERKNAKRCIFTVIHVSG